MSDPIVKVEKSLQTLIPKFLNYLQSEVASLKKAVAEKDFATLKSKGHTLKGGCGGYGFDDLGALARDLEEAAKQTNAPAAEKFVNQMSDYIQRMKIEYVDEL